VISCVGSRQESKWREGEEGRERGREGREIKARKRQVDERDQVVGQLELAF